MHCPKCGLEQHCCCKNCRPRHPDVPMWIIADNDGITCAGCGMTLHVDQWQELDIMVARATVVPVPSLEPLIYKETPMSMNDDADHILALELKLEDKDREIAKLKELLTQAQPNLRMLRVSLLGITQDMVDHKLDLDRLNHRIKQALLPIVGGSPRP